MCFKNQCFIIYQFCFYERAGFQRILPHTEQKTGRIIRTGSSDKAGVVQALQGIPTDCSSCKSLCFSPIAAVVYRSLSRYRY
jgi:hypothetical protein